MEEQKKVYRRGRNAVYKQKQPKRTRRTIKKEKLVRLFCVLCLVALFLTLFFCTVMHFQPSDSDSDWECSTVIKQPLKRTKRATRSRRKVAETKNTPQQGKVQPKARVSTGTLRRMCRVIRADMEKEQQKAKRGLAMSHQSQV